MLRGEGLVISAGTPALTFDVPDGRCLGFLSFDVSTLLHVAECAAGISAPFAGRVLVGDLDVVRDGDRARPRIAVGLARTAHRLTSLGEHAAAVARSRRTRASAADGIARLGLDGRTRLDTPSAQAAAALVAALLPDAPAVVLHDPFRHLDDGVRSKAIEWIRSLPEFGTSVLVTGTEERDVRAVSHAVIELGGGR